MRRTILSAFFSCLALVGCSNNTRTGDRPVFPVTGTVTYKGNPVMGADVTFFNKEANLSSFGRTDDQGKFRMTTYSSNDGSVSGNQIVTISKIETAAPPAQPTPDISSTAYNPPGMGTSTVPPAREKSDIPEKYGDPQKSGLTAVVRDNAPNELQFELTD